MNQKEIKELIELLVEHDITEFELERGDVKVHVRRGGSAPAAVQVAPAMSVIQPMPVGVPPAAPAGPSAPSAPPTPAAIAAEKKAAEAAADADLFIVKSPIVGTYYEAPSPGTPPFVKV